MPEILRSTIWPTASTSGLHHEHYKNGDFQGTGKDFKIYDLRVFLYAKPLC